MKELKSGTQIQDDTTILIRRYFTSCLVSLKNDLNIGVSAFKEKGKTEFGKKLQSISADALTFLGRKQGDINNGLQKVSDTLAGIASGKAKSFVDKSTQETVNYYDGFEIAEVEATVKSLTEFLESIGGTLRYDGPDEDMPIRFNIEELPDHIELIAQEQGALQFLDFFIMRIRTMLSDTRMSSIIGEDGNVTLEGWLKEYMSGTVVIDLSLVPSDLLHLVVSVVSRVIFEATQRYRRKFSQILPTVLVLEEAHNFIKKHTYSDDVSPSEVCSQVFEKIAKEGRKFGLSLMLSSQRPSELSDTVLSQCNTFLLHRIVNDRDQDLVRRLVPDNIGGLLRELPILPTRKAILLGWASPIPILVQLRELSKEHRPKSDDPDFWNVWTNNVDRPEKWGEIAEEWQSSVPQIDQNAEATNTDIAVADSPKLEDQGSVTDTEQDLPF